MNSLIKNLEKSINGHATLLRIVTPILTLLISILVTIALGDIKEIKADVDSALQLAYENEKNIIKIQSNRFTAKDAKLMFTEIAPWNYDKPFVMDKLIFLEKELSNIKN